VGRRSQGSAAFCAVAQGHLSDPMRQSLQLPYH